MRLGSTCIPTRTARVGTRSIPIACRRRLRKACSVRLTAGFQFLSSAQERRALRRDVAGSKIEHAGHGDRRTTWGGRASRRCIGALDAGPRERRRTGLRSLRGRGSSRILLRTFGEIFYRVIARISVLYACAAAMRVGSRIPAICGGARLINRLATVTRVNYRALVTARRFQIRGEERCEYSFSAPRRRWRLFRWTSRRRRRRRHLSGAHAPRCGARTTRARPAKSARRFASGGQNRRARPRELRPRHPLLQVL